MSKIKKMDETGFLELKLKLKALNAGFSQQEKNELKNFSIHELILRETDVFLIMERQVSEELANRDLKK